ncbi:MAG: hypothetical protein WCJ30_18120, partial [Deltaproteobacteria bacterium]
MSSSHGSKASMRAVAVALSLAGCAAGPARGAETLPAHAVAGDGPAATASDRPSPPSEAAACPGAVPSTARDALREQAPADVGAIPAYAHVNASGLASCVVRPGAPGPSPRADDRVA